MIKVSLIGKGKWGGAIDNALNSLIFTQIQWVEPKDADWVILATPNDLHYEQSMYWLSQGKNVFCEKPLTFTYESAELLYKYADDMGVKFYVDDVFAWRDDIKIQDDYNSFIWNKSDTSNYLERFAYHHFYLWMRYQKTTQIDKIEGDGKSFFIVLDDGSVGDFQYVDGDIRHTINDVNLLNYQSNPLQEMLESVLNNNVDFKMNKENTLNATKLLEEVRKVMYKKALVIGGGVFGLTSAITLSNNGFQVDVKEKSGDIMMGASFINQYRLHRGYHYPRSKETAQECLDGLTLFNKKYSGAVVNGNIDHMYGISSEDSLVSGEEYKKFLDDMNLPYKERTPLPNCDLTISVEENLFDPELLTQLLRVKLYGNGVRVQVNTEVTDLEQCKKDYDVVVIATYSQLNQLLENKKEYQFEVCEKPVVKLPKIFENTSIVIMDGPFMCLDPLGDYFVLGNVVHAIHETNIGTKPIVSDELKPYLNNDVIENPEITNIDKFIESGVKYFGEEFGDLEHIGSMYTIRTVLKDREHDDARPTLVNHEEDNVWSLFSGKIDTCVSASNELVKRINNELKK
tara:strand:- start:825 stop:2537 length:1713 start_codon:yes stop_codon:yes gene_type:complete